MLVNLDLNLINVKHKMNMIPPICHNKLIDCMLKQNVTKHIKQKGFEITCLVSLKNDAVIPW